MTKLQTALLLFIICLQLLRFIGYSHPHGFYFDETYSARTAVALSQANTLDIWRPAADAPLDKRFEWIHPPFARYLMVGSINLLGPTPTAWRLPSLIASLTTCALIVLIGRQLGSLDIGLVAATFFSLDGLSFTYSRIGTGDMVLTMLITAIVYVLLARKWLFTSLIFGLAISTKWTASGVIPVIVFAYLHQHDIRSFKTWLAIAGYSLISFSLYLLLYIPFFAIADFNHFLALHHDIWQRGMQLADDSHPSISYWYQWPIGWQPMVWFEDHEFYYLAIPNIIIYWAGLLSLATACINWVKGHLSYSLQLLTTAFLGMWGLFSIAWSIQYPHPRPTFIYYYLPLTPILWILTAAIIHQLPNKYKHLATASLIIIGSFIFIALLPELFGII